MSAPANAGRNLQVIFAEEDTVLEVELTDPASDPTETIVDAFGADDAKQAEQLLHDASDAAVVRRRE